MKQEWQNDVAVLKAWVDARKNDPGLTGVREYCANTRESWLRLFLCYFRGAA
jgi:two-component system aerobic respiration control sensor histidine kinase ArcB